MSKVLVANQEAWYIAVPTSAEFSQPQFNFGERVSWYLEPESLTHQLTGRIYGIWFGDSHWHYDITIDAGQNPSLDLEEFATLTEQDLTLIQDEFTLRGRVDPLCDWLPTRQAARRLGLLPEQLRNLRQQGRFMVGHHCRDASVPDSRRSLWQWHIGRCHEALASPLPVSVAP